MKNGHVAAGVLGLMLWTAVALAVSPVNKSLFGGQAIRGYDPVAYFESGQPQKGLKAFAHAWNGATWLFASEAHRAAFAAQPEKYAPQFGGYCAWAVSQGYTADIDPEAWRIVDGKLYLNYSPKIQKQWEEDTAGNIAKGEKNWPGLVGK
jgi:YHS domain-containing protein